MNNREAINELLASLCEPGGAAPLLAAQPASSKAAAPGTTRPPQDYSFQAALQDSTKEERVELDAALNPQQERSPNEDSESGWAELQALLYPLSSAQLPAVRDSKASSTASGACRSPVVQVIKPRASPTERPPVHQNGFKPSSEACSLGSLSTWPHARALDSQNITANNTEDLGSRARPKPLLPKSPPPLRKAASDARRGNSSQQVPRTVRSRQWWPRVQESNIPMQNPDAAVGQKGKFQLKGVQKEAPVETARAPSFRAAAPANGAPPQRAETQAASGRWISVMQPPVLRTIGADAARRNQKRATLGLSGDGSEVTPSKVAQPVAKTLFTMVLLDSQSRQQILQRVVLKFPKISADHMTIAFKPGSTHIAALPLGKEVELLAYAVAADSKCQALVIALHDLYLSEMVIGAPHVTLSVDPSQKFAAAGRLVEACQASDQPGFLTPLEPPLKLHGIICARLSDGSTAFARSLLPPAHLNQVAKGNGSNKNGTCPSPVDSERLASTGAPGQASMTGLEAGLEASASPLSGTCQQELEIQPAEDAVGQPRKPAMRRPVGHSQAGNVSGARAQPVKAASTATAGLDELLGRLEISTNWSVSEGLKSISTDFQAPASSLSQPGIGQAAAEARSPEAQHLRGASAPRKQPVMTSLQHPGKDLLQIEELLQAWSFAGQLTEPEPGLLKSDQPTLERSPPRLSSLERQDRQVQAKGGAESNRLPSSISDHNRRGTADAEGDFWSTLLDSAQRNLKEEEEGIEGALGSGAAGAAEALPLKQQDPQRLAPTVHQPLTTRLAAHSKAETAPLAKSQLEEAVEGAPLPPSRPGREAISRLWKPWESCQPSLAARVKPQPPKRLVRRKPLPEADSAPRAGQLKAAPDSAGEPEMSYEAWLRALSEETTAVGDHLQQPVNEDESVLPEPDRQGTPSNLAARLEPEKHALEDPPPNKQVVSFKIEASKRLRQPKTVAVAAFESDRAESAMHSSQEAGAASSGFEPSAQPVKASGDSSAEEEEIGGGPWWSLRALPSGHAAAAPAAKEEGQADDSAPGIHTSSGAAETGTGDAVNVYLQAWNASASPAAPRSETSKTAEGAVQPRRQIFRIPRNTFKQPVLSAPDKAVSDTEKAAAAGLEGSYESALDEIEADSLLRGLEEVVAEFPHINRNVAEMTLKSYCGDVKEAIEFLERTRLTATPSQIRQLGLKARQQGGRQLKKELGMQEACLSSSGDEAIVPLASRATAFAAPGFLIDRSPGATDLAESLLTAADDSEAVAMALNGAATTLAERKRLDEQSAAARAQSRRHYRARGIFKAAAEQAEGLGQTDTALMLKSLAHEQGQLGAECRQLCNAKAFECSNHGVTNRIKVDLHGMNVDEAMEKLQKHIINLSGLSSATFVLQVITGVGKHSHGGRAKLLPAVLNFLNTTDLAWEEEYGNPGQINVILAASRSS